MDLYSFVFFMAVALAIFHLANKLLGALLALVVIAVTAPGLFDGLGTALAQAAGVPSVGAAIGAGLGLAIPVVGLLVMFGGRPLRPRR